MRKTSNLLLTVALLLWAGTSLAHDTLEAEFRQALRDMGSDLRLMCLAAHPDDEDGATLAKYRKRYGIETHAVIATRGEGGQNEIGPELYNELGVLRTFEQLAAAEVTGTEVSFLNLAEFGYSKSREETFDIWGREETVRRVVRSIREIRPDVIITHHDPVTGHGHHQAIGAAALEAFDAAADPGAFPELAAEGLEPWQVKRLYVRVWEEPENSGAVEIDIYQTDAIEGISYAEIAARALEEHTSQGMQFFIERLRSGEANVWYVPVKTAAPEDETDYAPPPEGAALFRGLPDRVTLEDRALAQSEEAREDLKPRLIEALAAIEPDHPFAEPRLRRTEKATTLAMGLTLQAEVSDSKLIPGQSAEILVTVNDTDAIGCQTVDYTFNTLAWMQIMLYDPVSAEFADGIAAAALPFTVPEGQPVTMPHTHHLFDERFLEPQLEVVARVTCGERTLTLRDKIYFDIAPPVTVEFPGAPLVVFEEEEDIVPFTMRVTNHAPGPFEGNLIISPSSAFRIIRDWDQRTMPIAFTEEGEVQTIDLPLQLFPLMGEREVFVTVMLEGFDSVFHGQAQILHAEVPEDVHVGVITSYDTTIMDTLERLRASHEAIEEGAITPERLSQYDVVFVDIRAYHARDDLAANNQVLLDYVNQGGTAIVMYQKTFEWKPEYAPYPIQLSRNRVTQPDAPIEVLEPDHPLFNTPNTVVPEDWLGWVQERGLYFPNEWAEEYTPLIRTNDPSEDIPPGSLLTCEYGEGMYVYTALVWYRQLREAHPGALRIFANMIALGG